MLKKCPWVIANYNDSTQGHIRINQYNFSTATELILNDQLCSATLCQGWRGRLATFIPMNCVTSEEDAGGLLHITQKCMEFTPDSSHIISHLVAPPLFNHYLNVKHSRSSVTTVLASFGRLMRHLAATGSSSLMQLMWLIGYSTRRASDLLQRGSPIPVSHSVSVIVAAVG